MMFDCCYQNSVLMIFATILPEIFKSTVLYLPEHFALGLQKSNTSAGHWLGNEMADFFPHV